MYGAPGLVASQRAIFSRSYVRRRRARAFVGALLAAGFVGLAAYLSPGLGR